MLPKHGGTPAKPSLPASRGVKDTGLEYMESCLEGGGVF